MVTILGLFSQIGLPCLGAFPNSHSSLQIVQSINDKQLNSSIDSHAYQDETTWRKGNTAEMIPRTSIETCVVIKPGAQTIRERRFSLWIPAIDVALSSFVVAVTDVAPFMFLFFGSQQVLGCF
nr:hypothetical protein Iba_chr03aCG20290 [Ipomoea batatas]